MAANRSVARGLTCAALAVAVTAVGLTPAAAQEADPAVEAPAEPPAASGVPEVPETPPSNEGTAVASAELLAGIAASAQVPEGFVEGESVELVEERTEFSKTFHNLDATTTVESSLLPMHWWDDGWVDIDTSIIADEGGFRSASNAWTARFRALPHGVTITTPDGDLAFSPVGATAVEPEKLEDADGVIYRNAWDGVDLVYQVRPDGIKEDLVLHRVPDVTHFDFTTDGRQYVYDDGGLRPVGEGDLGQLAAAEMLDVEGRPISDAQPSVVAVDWPSQLPKLVVRFDRNHLNTLPESAFPLLLDPTTVFVGSNMVNYKSDGHIGCDPCGPHIRVGNSQEPSGPNYWRSVGTFKFGRSSNLGHIVSEATLDLGWQEFGNTAPYRMRIFKASSSSWSGAKSGTELSSKDVTHFGELDLTEALAGPITTDESIRLGFVGYESSSHYSYKAFRDFRLIVTSAAPMVAPGLVAPGNGATTAVTTINYQLKNNHTTESAYLAVGVEDANGNYVTHGYCTNSGGLRMVAPGGTCTITLDAPGPNGHYRWYGVAWLANNSAASGTRVFTIDRDGPNISNVAGWPSGINDGFRPWGWNYVIFDAADLSGINGFSYIWNQSATSVPDTIAESSGVCSHESPENLIDWFVAVPNLPASCAGGAAAGNAPDGTWYLHIRARNGADVWGPAIHVRHRFDQTPPSTPQFAATCMTPSVGGPSVTMKWDPATDATSGVRGYSWLWTNSATQQPDHVSVEGTGTESSSGPLADGSWYFHLKALDNSVTWVDGSSNASPDNVYGPIVVSGGQVTQAPGGVGWSFDCLLSPPPPEDPSPFAATNVVATRGDMEVSVTWDAPQLAMPILTDYVVTAYRQSDDVAVGSVQTPDTHATITGLKNGTSVYVRVVATYIGYPGPPSGPSNTVTPAGIPFAPEEVVAESGDSEITVTWSPPTDRPDGTPGNNGEAITQYTIRVYLSADDSLVDTTTTTGEATSTQVDGLVNGTSYYATVRATNAIGNGPSTASDHVIPAGKPLAPVDVQAEPGNGESVVSWTAPQPVGDVPGDNGRPIIEYLVESSGGQSTEVSGTEVTATVTGLTNGNSYTFRVRARNEIGLGDYSLPSPPVVPAGPPSVPQDVVAIPGNGQITITWSPSLPNGGSNLRYAVVDQFGNE